VIGWDFNYWPGEEGENLVADNEPLDRNGHGTHVAGIVCAITNNGVSYQDERGDLGVAGLAGGWENAGSGVRFIAVKTNPDLVARIRNLDTRTAAKAIIYASDNGAHIANMSFGTSSPNRAQFYIDAINTATGTNLDEDTYFDIGAIGIDVRHTLLIAATGNVHTDNMHWPAAFPTVLAVVASNINDEKAYFSTYGTWADISAPGVNIFSTMPRDEVDILRPGNNIPFYGNMSGTSMACPYVAGLACLIKSQHMGLNGDQICSRILGSAVDINQNTDPLVDLFKLGAGRIDAFDAVNLPDQPGFVISSVEIDDGVDNLLHIGDQAEIIMSFINVWDIADNATAILTTATPNVQIIDDESILGQINPEEEGSNVEDTWEVLIEEDFEDGPVWFTVTFSDGDFQQERTFALHVHVPPVGGFPVDLGSRLQSSPALFDVDNEGELDIVIGSQDGNMYAYDNQGEVTRTYQTNAAISSHPAIADIDNDGDYEIIIGNNNGNLYCFAANGDNIFGPIDLNDSPVMGTMLIDGNNDGILEIIVCTVSPDGENDLFIYNNLGQLLWSVDALGEIASGPVGGDIDNDGDREFLIGTRPDDEEAGHLLAYDVIGDGAGSLWQIDRTTTSLVLGDVSGDGDLDVATVENFGEWSGYGIRNAANGNIIRQQGMDFWRYEFSDVIVSEIVPNNDGLELIFTSVFLGTDLLVWGLNNGQFQWLATDDFFFIENQDLLSAPIVVDMDGDAGADIIFTFANGIYAIDENFDIRPLFPIFKAESTENPEPHPAIGAIAGQPIHLIVGTDDGEHGFVYNYQFNGLANPRNAQWPTYMHDNQRTGCYSQPVEGQLPENSIIRWQGRVSVVNDLTVPVNSTLQIDPGTVVEIHQNVDIIVNGTLIANGALNDSIYFICSNRELNWGKIILNGITSDNSRIDYCVFENMSTGVELSHVTLSEEATIANCTFNNGSNGMFIEESDTDVELCAFNNCNTGIYVYDYTNLAGHEIRECNFTSCFTGVYLYMGLVTTISGCEFNIDDQLSAGITTLYCGGVTIGEEENPNIFTGNPQENTTGIIMKYTSQMSFPLILDHNTISGCTYGVELYSANPRLVWNVIEDNRDYGLFMFNFSQPDLSTDARNRIVRHGLSEMWVDNEYFPLLDGPLDENEGHNDIFNQPDNQPDEAPYFVCGINWQGLDPQDAGGNYWGALVDVVDPTLRFVDSAQELIPVNIEPRSDIPYTGDDIDEFALLFFQALQLERDGNWNEANSLYRRIIREAPESQYCSISMSHLLHVLCPEDEDYSELSEYLSGIAEGFENENFAKRALDLASYANVLGGEFEAAIQHYEAVLEDDPPLRDSVYAVIDAGFVYYVAAMAGDEGEGGGEVNMVRRSRNHDDISYVPQYGKREDLKPSSVMQHQIKIRGLLTMLKGHEIHRKSNIPIEFFLAQNYPNPFNNVTHIRYGLKEDAKVSITIYDISGRNVKNLVNVKQEAGYHSVVWDGNNNSDIPTASGVYIYRIKAGQFVRSCKLIMLK